MGRLLSAMVSGALVLGLLATGCGSSSSGSSGSGSSDSKTQSTHAKSTGSTLTIGVSSPAFNPGGPIQALFTCDGADESPPLNWGAIPEGTAELVLFVVDLTAKAQNGEPPIHWAVAGLQPTLTGLSAGKLPAGAIVGRNSLGQIRYSICPPKGPVRHYAVALYAIPHRVPTTPGFAARPLLEKVSNLTVHEGLSAFSYQRV